jgi:hypothetical protein
METLQRGGRGSRKRNYPKVEAGDDSLNIWINPWVPIGVNPQQRFPIGDPGNTIEVQVSEKGDPITVKIFPFSQSSPQELANRLGQDIFPSVIGAIRKSLSQDEWEAYKRRELPQ